MTQQEIPQAAQGQMSTIKAAYEDGVATIGGVDYVFSKLNHKQRRTVFAFLTRIQHMLKAGDFSFLEWADFQKVEKLIEDTVMVDNSQISKHDGYWEDEERQEHYLKFITISMSVIAYPLMRGGSGA